MQIVTIQVLQQQELQRLIQQLLIQIIQVLQQQELQRLIQQLLTK